MTSYQHVGVSAPIHDGIGKATGGLQYVADMQLPNLHYAKLVLSTIPHGVVKKVDTTEAEQVPGVVKILTCFHTTDRLYSRARVCVWEEPVYQEQLFPRVVKFVEDRVAMVIAKTPAAAKSAAKLIRVEYEELPFVITPEQAMQPNAVKIYPKGNIFPFEGMECGRLPEKGSLQEITSKLTLSALHHGAMEPHGCVADYDKYQQKLTLYSPCQSVFAIRATVADLFQLPYHKVQVLQTTMGGSFGSKQETILEPLAAAAALAVAAPVKLVLEREEVFAATILRAPMKFQSKALVQNDGKIASISIDCTIQAGAYLTNSLDYLYAMGEKLSRLYDIPHIRFTGRAVCTNTPVSGSYRSWGSNDIALPLEQLFWKISQTLKLDLLQLHQINALVPNAPHTFGGGAVGDCRIQQCLAEGAATFQWQQRKTACQIWNRQHRRIKKGVGMAAGAHVNGFYPAMEFANVMLKVNEDGSILANLCLHDHGCGTMTAFRKIIAEVLAVEESAIEIHRPNTDWHLYDYGCYGSRTVYVIGKAAQNCAETLRDMLLAKAAESLGQPVEQMQLREGGVLCFATGQTLSYGQIAQYCQQKSEELYAVEAYQAVDNPTSSGVHFVQIAVDTLTGRSVIERYHAIYDIGQAINPAMCKAQIGGAIQQGIGAALTEGIVFSQENGAVCNDNFHKYHLVNIPDMPEPTIDFLEHQGDHGPFSAKSIGETAIVPAAPAVFTALENALAEEAAELPMTPLETVALYAQKKGGEER